MTIAVPLQNAMLGNTSKLTLYRWSPFIIQIKAQN